MVVGGIRDGEVLGLVKDVIGPEGYGSATLEYLLGNGCVPHKL